LVILKLFVCLFVNCQTVFLFLNTEDQIHQMIRSLSEQCNVDSKVVAAVVNNMFESGQKYDDQEAVRKVLVDKVRKHE
jgi:hypothetical protein